MKSSNEIDRKFKNGVDNFELTPKSNSWDQVTAVIRKVTICSIHVPTLSFI